ncbi:MAG TPA: alkaline phosphatase family protein [Candidatus Acidoferrum sp.]|nr:alkaline phosphatase family protein [Candidatus Acidoferrum sp.]
MKRFPKWMFAAAAIALLVAGVFLWHSIIGGPQPSARHHKLIVLGIDGMDPSLLRQFIATGKMPNFALLATQGSFLALQTSTPPQSPVAWSNLITGMNPGGHGVFDFIHRDPATLTPYFSTARVTPPAHNLRLGGWVIPISTGEVSLLRKGKAFWQYLDDRHVPTFVLRMPANFPPVASGGKTLAGLGTPDLLGGYGTFSFYTDNPAFVPGPVDGGVIYPVQISGNHVEAVLHGPPNSFRSGNPELTIPFTIERDANQSVARLAIQSQQFVLSVGEWSSWVHVKFTFVPGLEEITGICRFYLKQVHPEFELYVSPINLDPAEPALPLSTPKGYSPDLVDELGPFYTQGIAEDTKALTSAVLNDDEYLDQARLVFEDQRRIFLHELARFRSGLFFHYFSSIDLNSHMFWRADDPRSPSYGANLAKKYGHVIENYYHEMDAMLGEALKVSDADTTVLVVSDHGFAPFRRSFNLNTWLVEKGYLVLHAGAQPGPDTNIFADADWSKTRAYGLGLNGLYLNLSGRERNGIVNPGVQAEALQTEIVGQLEAERDPLDGEQVITRVDRAAHVYSGPESSQAPDMIVGYNSGFRVGWSSVLGGIPAPVLEDNTDPWSGDHCIDYTKVPGVVLSNRRIANPQPALIDIAPTILAEFGIPRPATMQGHDIFVTSTSPQVAREAKTP